MTMFRDIMGQLGFVYLENAQVLAIADCVDDFEKQLVVNLPHDYRDFLFAFSGSCFTGFVSTILTLEKLGEKIPVECFYGFFPVNEGCYSPYDLRYACQTHADWLPTGYLPIASAYYGNQFYLSARGSDIGCVYFWDGGDTSTIDEGEASPFFVASSFIQFIRSLQCESSE